MAEARIERRLAAILAADVAGHSRLMGTDEEGTLAALKELRRDLADPKIVKTTGDGLLVEFASVGTRCVAPSRFSAKWPHGMLGFRRHTHPIPYGD